MERFPSGFSRLPREGRGLALQRCNQRKKRVSYVSKAKTGRIRLRPTHWGNLIPCNPPNRHHHQLGFLCGTCCCTSFSFPPALTRFCVFSPPPVSPPTYLQKRLSPPSSFSPQDWKVEKAEEETRTYFVQRPTASR